MSNFAITLFKATCAVKSRTYVQKQGSMKWGNPIVFSITSDIIVFCEEVTYMATW